MKVVIPVMSFGKGGGERVLSKLSNELVKHGCDVYFVALGNSSEIYHETSAKIIKSKVSNSNNRIIKFVMNNYYLYKKCMELEPDCAIANFHLTAYMVSMLPRRVRKFYYIQAYEVDFYKSAFRRFIAYLTYLLPLKKIVNHDGLLPKRLNSFIAVLPAGIDDSIFHGRNLIETRKNIGIIGRKEKHKGTSRVIDVILAWENNENITLNIALYLDENDREKLSSRGVEFSVFDINNDRELAAFYRMNDLIIATGLIEDGAFHYPCAEAIACRCAVISNYSPLFNTNSKLKLSTFNDDELLEKLRYFVSMTDSEVHEEIQSNSSALKGLSWTHIGNKFYTLLQENTKQVK